MDAAKALGRASGIDATFGLQASCPGCFRRARVGKHAAGVPELLCLLRRACSVSNGQPWHSAVCGSECMHRLCGVPVPNRPQPGLLPSLPCRCKSRSTAAGAGVSRSTTATYSTSTTPRWAQQLLDCDGHAQGRAWQPTPWREQGRQRLGSKCSTVYTVYQSPAAPIGRPMQATTLRTLSALHTSLGEMLADDAAQHPKSCDTDMGGCGKPSPVTHVLQAAPRVFTLQVGVGGTERWGGARWAGQGLGGGSHYQLDVHSCRGWLQRLQRAQACTGGCPVSAGGLGVAQRGARRHCGHAGRHPRRGEHVLRFIAFHATQLWHVRGSTSTSLCRTRALRCASPNHNSAAGRRGRGVQRPLTDKPGLLALPALTPSPPRNPATLFQLRRWMWARSTAGCPPACTATPCAPWSATTARTTRRWCWCQTPAAGSCLTTPASAASATGAWCAASARQGASSLPCSSTRPCRWRDEAVLGRDACCGGSAADSRWRARWHYRQPPTWACRPGGQPHRCTGMSQLPARPARPLPIQLRPTQVGHSQAG